VFSPHNELFYVRSCQVIRPFRWIIVGNDDCTSQPSYALCAARPVIRRGASSPLAKPMSILHHASTPAYTTHISVSTNAQHMHLPNTRAGISLPPMASSRRRQSSLHEHFRRGALYKTIFDVVILTSVATHRGPRHDGLPSSRYPSQDSDHQPAMMRISRHGGEDPERTPIVRSEGLL
jgi:hypothetical protein